MCSAAPCKSAVKDTHKDILGDVKEDLERPHATSRQAAPRRLRKERAGAVLGRLCDRRAGKGRGLPEGASCLSLPLGLGAPTGRASRLLPHGARQMFGSQGTDRQADAGLCTCTHTGGGTVPGSWHSRHGVLRHGSPSGASV